MSIVSLVGTQGLLQQARNDLVVWSEAHQEKWATNDHDCSPNHYAKKKKNKKKPHASYTARARAARRAIYTNGIINFDTATWHYSASTKPISLCCFFKHFGKLPHFQDGTSWHIYIAIFKYNDTCQIYLFIWPPPFAIQPLACSGCHKLYSLKKVSRVPLTHQ